MAQARATTTDEVLAAAARVFRDKGYRNATLDDIAAEAGVSKPTLYRYSEGKQWLLDSIARKVRETLRDRVDEHTHLTGIDALRATIVAAARSTQDLRVYYEAMSVNVLELSAEDEAERREWMKEATLRTAQTLQQCREEGSMHLPGKPAIYANLVQSVLRGIFTWYDPDGTTTPEELAQHMIDLFALDVREDIAASPSHSP
ncbi:TetR/AcrR family transcriptional regulator [Brevibacterium album]|uniref:TetR/AcrR family transcriptional regulator n=1 Tax=Brevibacterium album TaxID=417948 RepID=UPI0003F5A107|nr:TetR/AcrR family transcriptional regulator [Brevibacterium album]